jgi:hypothetical protein
LAANLFSRYENYGSLSDLEMAVAHQREATRLSPIWNHNHVTEIGNLASYILRRFERLGEEKDLEESIALHREALVLRPAPHPDQSGSLNNLANALSTQFQQKGDLGDLEESIALHREALVLFPAPHPDRSASLNNLASALSTQFQQKGDLGDLEESIALHHEALVLRPAPHPLRSRSLNNLASALSTQFQQKGGLGDLEESIALHREALVLFPAPHPDRSGSLNNLENALSTRFQQKGDLGDLEESIALHREALVLRPTPHPLRSGSLNNLASALSTRFEQKGDLGNLEESIALHREALVLFPAPHPLRSASLNNLASALSTRFQQKGDSQDLEESMIHFSNASQYDTASIIDRFRFSRRWAQCAVSAHHSSALQAYQNTINLLPHLASLALNLQKRHEALSRARGLASEACSYAIQIKDFDKAVEFLCAGRAVFWAQALQLHTPFDELHAICPDLAEKLQDISRALKLAASSHDTFQPLQSDSQYVRDLEKEAARYRLLNDDWNHTLEQVRSLDGFEDFLQPKSISKLQEASSKGPVIMLNASATQCDALVVTQDQVKHVALSNITAEMAHVLGSVIQIALSPNGIHSAHDKLQPLLELIHTTEHRKRDPPSEVGFTAEDLFEHILRLLWLTVTHPVIQELNLKV